jgi:hypothetical protein
VEYQVGDVLVDRPHWNTIYNWFKPTYVLNRVFIIYISFSFLVFIIKFTSSPGSPSFPSRLPHRSHKKPLICSGFYNLCFHLVVKFNGCYRFCRRPVERIREGQSSSRQALPQTRSQGLESASTFYLICYFKIQNLL